MSVTQAPLVLVTGVSGFIASWVAHGALKLGYRVRGTVRSLKNEDKIKHLRDLCPGSQYKVELVEADLLDEESWVNAVVGCDYILHVASPFVIDEPKDPNDLILPAINGTINVLKAAAKLDKPPKRVVVTSSSAAILYGSNPHGKIFTDNDWTVVDSPEFPVSAYYKSKYLAEKAAWDFVEKLPADKKFELCTVNPTLVQGPMLSGSQCSSAEIVKQVRVSTGDIQVLFYLNCLFVMCTDYSGSDSCLARHQLRHGVRVRGSSRAPAGHDPARGRWQALHGDQRQLQLQGGVSHHLQGVQASGLLPHHHAGAQLARAHLGFLRRPQGPGHHWQHRPRAPHGPCECARDPEDGPEARPQRHRADGVRCHRCWPHRRQEQRQDHHQELRLSRDGRDWYPFCVNTAKVMIILFLFFVSSSYKQ